MILPAPEWIPDQTNDGTGTAHEDIIQNVIPDVDSYRPWQNLTQISGAMTARAQGAFAAIDGSRNAYDYGGDANNLYRLISLSWIRASNATLSATWSYSTSLDQWWEFEQWNNTVLATNGHDPVQEITLGSSNFVDLAGAPPVAYHMAVVKDFVWLGNLSGFPQRVRWSAINNSQSWTVAATTQADFQDLVGDGGHVKRIIGGETATVFQERAIWKAQYVGSPGIFDFGNGPIARDVGLLASQSAVRYGSSIFFLSEGGFYRLDPGGIEPIGRNKIDRTVFADMDSQYIYRVHAVINPLEKLYLCAYPGSGNTGGRPNRILVYNFEVGRWAVIVEDVEMLWRYISAGYTLEGLDPFGTLDTLPASLDSALWAGGQISLAAFNSSHQTAVFNGTAKDATVTTREFAPLQGRRAKITRVRALVDANEASVTPITRNRLADARVIGSAASQNSSGDCPMRTNANYFSFRIGTTGAFTRIRGVEVLDVSDAGSR
jgi:hypothetical protein